MPPEASAALTHLGEHLALARLRRMERGDPTVSMGTYATTRTSLITQYSRFPLLS